MAVNRVILFGNVGKNPEVKTFENGNKVVSFTVATSEIWTDKDGERKEQTEWHNISVFGKTADFVEKYVEKGARVFIEGKLRTRSFTTQSGEKRFITEILCQSIQLLDKKKSDNASQEYNQPQEDFPF